MLDAGSVRVTLGGSFNPAAFDAFNAKMKQTIAQTEAGDAKMSAANRRMSESSSAAFTKSAKSSEQWSKVNKQAAQNMSTLGTVAAKGAAVGIVAVGAAALYAAAKASTFDREMLKLHTQAGATTAEVNKFSSAILKLAGNVPQTPAELSQGLYHLASAGFKGSQALEMLKASAEGAAIGGAKLEDVTNAVVAATASHIKGVHSAADAMGQLNAIVGTGNMRMEDFSKSMGSGILTVAEQAGLSLTDVGAAMATLTDNGVPAVVAAQRLKTALLMMASPTKAATKELESIGMTSKSMAEDMRQPKGLDVAVTDLTKHLKDSGKSAVETDAIFSKVFGRARSSSTMMTLASQQDRFGGKYKFLEETNGVERLGKAWAEFQKESSAQFRELKSGAQAFAIVVGHAVLPELSKLAVEGKDALQGFAQSGGAKTLGQDLTKGFDEAGKVISGLTPLVEELAKALYDVGKFAGLGNASEIEALAVAFAAFKSAEFVAPMLTAIKLAFVEASAAAAGMDAVMGGGGLAAGAATFASMLNPITATVAVAIAAGAAFLLLSSKEESAAQAAEKVAQATKDEQAALSALQDTILAAASATFGAVHATTELAKAHAHAVAVGKEYGKNSQQYKVALQEETEVALRKMEADKRVNKEYNKIQEEKEKARAKAKGEVDAAKNQRNIELQAIGNKMLAGEISPSQARADAIAPLTKYNAIVQKAAAGTALAAISQIQLDRALQGTNAITEQSAVSVAKLTSVWDELSAAQRKKLAATPENQLAEIGNLVGSLQGVPTRQKTEIIVDSHSARATIEAFKAVLSGVPPAKVIQVLVDAKGAKLQLEAVKALAHGVPASKLISIETNGKSAAQQLKEVQDAEKKVPPGKLITLATNAPGAQSAMDALRQSIEALPSFKEIKIATIMETLTKAAKAIGHASGRSTGAAEPSLVGEGHGPEYIVNRRTGAGAKVTRPTLMGLGSDDYVIPLEDRFRGRALGLFMMLARDLGIEGHKKGKKPAAKAAPGKAAPAHPGKSWKIPSPPPALLLPLGDIETQQQAAKSTADKAQSQLKSDDGKVASLEKQVRVASRAKKPDRAKLAELHKELAKVKQAQAVDAKRLTADKRQMTHWATVLSEAKKQQTEIKTAELEVSNDANAMKLAADHDDLGAYNAAKGKRLGTLKHLQDLVRKAKKIVDKVHPGSEYGLELEGQLQKDELEAHETEGEAFTPSDPAAEREAQSGMTDAEAARLKEVKKEIALAALTPDLADDKHGAEDLVNFLTNVLGEAQAQPGARGGDEVIASLAEQLKTARDNVTSLTSGGAQNENADLQAQINQANERAEVAKKEAQISNQALAVFGGSGDIGAGGKNAQQAAAGVVIHVNTLHPGDPATLSAIGAAATAGIGLQGSRRAVRERFGI
jgi:TP901 family phage tail tape measure protein